MLDKNMLFLTKVQIDLKCHIAAEPDTSLNCLSPPVYGFFPTVYTTALQDPQSAEPVDARRPRRETLHRHYGRRHSQDDFPCFACVGSLPQAPCVQESAVNNP